MGYKPNSRDTATRNDKAIMGGHVTALSCPPHRIPRPLPITPAASRCQNTNRSCDWSARCPPASTHPSPQQRGNLAGKTPDGVETERRKTRRDGESAGAPPTGSQTVRRVCHAYGVPLLTLPAEPIHVVLLVQATPTPIRLVDLSACTPHPDCRVAESPTPGLPQIHAREAGRPIQTSVGGSPTPTHRSTLRLFRLSPSSAALARLATVLLPVVTRDSPPSNGLTDSGATRRGDETPQPPALAPAQPDETLAGCQETAPTRLGGSLLGTGRRNNISREPGATSRSATTPCAYRSSTGPMNSAGLRHMAETTQATRGAPLVIDRTTTNTRVRGTLADHSGQDGSSSRFPAPTTPPTARVAHTSIMTTQRPGGFCYGPCGPPPFDPLKTGPREGPREPQTPHRELQARDGRATGTLPTPSVGTSPTPARQLASVAAPQSHLIVTNPPGIRDSRKAGKIPGGFLRGREGRTDAVGHHVHIGPSGWQDYEGREYASHPITAKPSTHSHDGDRQEVQHHIANGQEAQYRIADRRTRPPSPLRSAHAEPTRLGRPNKSPEGTSPTWRGTEAWAHTGPKQPLQVREAATRQSRTTHTRLCRTPTERSGGDGSSSHLADRPLDMGDVKCHDAADKRSSRLAGLNDPEETSRAMESRPQHNKSYCSRQCSPRVLGQIRTCYASAGDLWFREQPEFLMPKCGGMGRSTLETHTIEPYDGPSQPRTPHGDLEAKEATTNATLPVVRISEDYGPARPLAAVAAAHTHLVADLAPARITRARSSTADPPASQDPPRGLTTAGELTGRGQLSHRELKHLVRPAASWPIGCTTGTARAVDTLRHNGRNKNPRRDFGGKGTTDIRRRTAGPCWANQPAWHRRPGNEDLDAEEVTPGEPGPHDGRQRTRAMLKRQTPRTLDIEPRPLIGSHERRIHAGYLITAQPSTQPHGNVGRSDGPHASIRRAGLPPQCPVCTEPTRYSSKDKSPCETSRGHRPHVADVHERRGVEQTRGNVHGPSGQSRHIGTLMGDPLQVRERATQQSCATPEEKAGNPPSWPYLANASALRRLKAGYLSDGSRCALHERATLARKPWYTDSEKFGQTHGPPTADRAWDQEPDGTKPGKPPPYNGGRSSAMEPELRIPDKVGSEREIWGRISRGREWRADAIGQRAHKGRHVWRNHTNDPRTAWSFSQLYDNRWRGSQGPGWASRRRNQHVQVEGTQVRRGQSKSPSQPRSAPTESVRTRRLTRSPTGTSYNHRRHLEHTDNNGGERTGG
ncbi:hypothetical protein BDV93DRAFT_506754 [Ceratobasidium sp. AG-I]|nr:hypothetical protein BDV93DRAFT_506754 [Ceratobasidium sp. AG-I]